MLISCLLVLHATFVIQDATRTGLDELDIRNWTPDVDARWRNPEWRRFGEEKIHDDRFMETDYGPMFCASIRVVGTGDGTLVRSRKGLAVRLGGTEGVPEAMVVYERNLLQCQAGWIGGWLKQNDGRFGLLDVPTNAAEPIFHAPARQAFRRGENTPDAHRSTEFFPLPVEVGRFVAAHLHGADVLLEFDVGGTRVLELATLEHAEEGEWAIVRNLEFAPDSEPISMRLHEQGDGEVPKILGDADLRMEEDMWVLDIPPSESVRRVKLIYSDAEGFDDSLRSLSLSLEGDRPLRWPETIETAIEPCGTSGPYVHERVLPPFENPWKSLMFLGGLDTLADGRPVVSTLFGDVWVVSNIDEGTPTWKRFATGLNQPMGIRIVDGRMLVLERGQLTELIDHDQDGEADEYRNINNRWHTTGDPHCFDINLEIDPQGNYYFIKNGSWHTPTGGCLLRIAADGSGDAEIYATGFRHCNSLGISPSGQLASGGQQGTWQPATRLDLNHEGGFYGLMEAAHREVEFYDRPLIWMPLEADNSAGDPVWAPEGWGPLGGSLLHLSWGQCWLMRILEEEVEGVRQGAAVVLPLGRFMAGPSRGRFCQTTGDLWVAGSMGWQTWGPWDGALDRIRYVGGEEQLPTPSSLKTRSDGLELGFDVKLERSIAEDPKRYSLLQWNYHWSSGYGSAHWRTTAFPVEGEEELEIAAVRLSADGHTVFLQIDDLRPAMQTRVGWILETTEGAPIEGVAYATTHRVPLSGSGTIDALAEPTRLEEMIFQDVAVELVWSGPIDGVGLRLRAIDGEEEGREGVLIPIVCEGDGVHRFRAEVRGRQYLATLDGERVFEEFETDTRLPMAGAVELDGVEVFGDSLLHFTVEPLSGDE